LRTKETQQDFAFKSSSSLLAVMAAEFCSTCNSKAS